MNILSMQQWKLSYVVWWYTLIQRTKNSSNLQYVCSNLLIAGEQYFYKCAIITFVRTTMKKHQPKQFEAPLVAVMIRVKSKNESWFNFSKDLNVEFCFAIWHFRKNFTEPSFNNFQCFTAIQPRKPKEQLKKIRNSEYFLTIYFLKRFWL